MRESIDLESQSRDENGQMDSDSGQVGSGGSEPCESIVSEAIVQVFSKTSRFKELPKDGEDHFPSNPFTTHAHEYNLVKGHTGDFVSKSGFMYNPKLKLYTAPSGAKYTHNGSSFVRQDNKSSNIDAAAMDERKVTSEGGDGLEEDRAPVKVSMSLSLSSSAKARRRKGSDGFLSAAPLGPKVHQQEAALEGDLDAEEKEHEGPSEFESYFQAEEWGTERQARALSLSLPSSSSIPALTASASSGYVDRAAERREQGGGGLNSYERPASHNPIVQAAVAKAHRKEQAAAEKEKQKISEKGPEHDPSNKGNSLAAQDGLEGCGRAGKEGGRHRQQQRGNQGA